MGKVVNHKSCCEAAIRAFFPRVYRSTRCPSSRLQRRSGNARGPPRMQASLERDGMQTGPKHATRKMSGHSGRHHELESRSETSRFPEVNRTKKSNTRPMSSQKPPPKKARPPPSAECGLHKDIWTISDKRWMKLALTPKILTETTLHRDSRKMWTRQRGDSTD